MTRLLRSLAIAAGIALVALPVRAQDAATLAAAEDLFDLIGDAMVDELVESAVAQAWPGFESALPSEVDAETRALLRNEMVAALRDYAVQSLAAGPAIYAEYFTEAELRGLLEFYQTPLGIRLLESQGQISLAMSELIMSTMEAAAQDLIGRLSAILEERGYI